MKWRALGEDATIVILAALIAVSAIFNGFYLVGISRQTQRLLTAQAAQGRAETRAAEERARRAIQAILDDLAAQTARHDAEVQRQHDQQTFLIVEDNPSPCPQPTRTAHPSPRPSSSPSTSPSPSPTPCRLIPPIC